MSKDDLLLDCKEHNCYCILFLQIHSALQSDSSMSPKEKFLLVALMKQKWPNKVNTQKKRNTKLTDKLKQAEKKIMDVDNKI